MIRGTHHSYSLDSFSQFLEEHRDDVGMSCCYGSQQLPSYLRVSFSGRQTDIRHLRKTRKAKLHKERYLLFLLKREEFIINLSYVV